MKPSQTKSSILFNRRDFLSFCSVLGISTSFVGDFLGQEFQQDGSDLTPDMIKDAAALAGLEVTEREEEALLRGVQEQIAGYREIRSLELGNRVSPPLIFEPLLPSMTAPETVKEPLGLSRKAAIDSPRNLEELAFASVRELADLLRRRRISSIALTEMYLDRLRRYDPLLKFVITLTEDRAVAQAREADRAISAGKYLGPLHGIPWGAKDLLNVKGYPTTWGASGFEKQYFADDASVVRRLDTAGAVLVAKLSLGAFAMGADEWFGGKTRNPWRPEQGASGSSAGSASAVASGCVGFAIGSETLDSIASPAARCGATGLRPTFGRVPRTGAMALCWSLDKLGPICRTVEDCAIVLDAINGSDGQDLSSRDVPFNWNSESDVSGLRVGYLESQFKADSDSDRSGEPASTVRSLESHEINQEALRAFDRLGVGLEPVELPAAPWEAMLAIAKAEAAATLDKLTRTNNYEFRPNQNRDWLTILRVARFIPAVEYINANRARTVAMEGMERLFESIDVLVAPTERRLLVNTNLTGHPALVLPSGFFGDGTPSSLTFVGKLYGEVKMLALAHAYQEATTWHKEKPRLDNRP